MCQVFRSGMTRRPARHLTPGVLDPVVTYNSPVSKSMDFHVSSQHLSPTKVEGQHEHPGRERVVITSSGVREELAGLSDGPRRRGLDAFTS